MSQALDLNQGLQALPSGKLLMPDLSESDPKEAGDLSIAPLGESNLHQAYALVQLHDTDLTLRAWCGRVGEDWKEGRSHWAVVRDRRGYIHAVFRYGPRTSAELSQQSSVTDLYAAGLAKRQALAAIRAWSPDRVSTWPGDQTMPSDWLLVAAKTSEF